MSQPLIADMHASRLRGAAIVLCLAGAAAFAACFFIEGGAPRAWSSLLMGLMLPLWLAVGALFFLSAHALGGARWLLPAQRVMEGMGAGLPLAVVAFLALGTLGLPYVYDWSVENPGRESLFRTAGKAWWMQDARWLITGAAILCLLDLLRRAWSASAADAAGLARRERRSVVALLVLVPAFTLLMWDLLLSLHVQWVSAVFGAYCLVSAIHLFLGATALALAWLGRRGLAQAVQPHLRRDLGTWMVAWSCIIAYISYVQYVIIAFANIDEESFWYLMRMQHGYGAEAVAEVVLRCLVPFALLLSQGLRTRPWAQAAAGAAILAGTWLNLHWLVAPAFSPNHYRLPVGPEAVVALGFLAATLLLAMRFWRRRGLLPQDDPRLKGSIDGEHLHA